MDDYVSKPLQSDELDRVIERWVPVQGPLDSARLEELRELGAPVFARLTGVFCEQAPLNAREVLEAAEAADGSAVRLSAHKLKGSALAVGAGSLAAKCELLVIMGDEGRLEEAAALAPELAELGRGGVPGARSGSSLTPR